MQHFYCLIWLPWSPLRWNGKMFAAFTVLGLVFGFQVERLHKYNILLFNLLFLFMDGISRPKSISRYSKIHGSSIYWIYINKFILPKKDDTRWIKENNEFYCFTVLTSKALNLWNTIQSLFLKHTKYLTKFLMI